MRRHLARGGQAVDGGNMHMPAKRHGRLAAGQAGTGSLGVRHIVPCRGIGRFRMHEQDIPGPDLERQACKERLRRLAQAFAGPVQRLRRCRIHVFRWFQHGHVMIAENGDGARFGQGPHPVDDRFGVWPITDEITEERKLVRIQPARRRQAGLECGQIRMDVREKGDPHGENSSTSARRAEHRP